MAQRQVFHLGDEARRADRQHRLHLLDHHLGRFAGEAERDELFGVLRTLTHLCAHRCRFSPSLDAARRGLAGEPHADHEQGEPLVLREVGVAAQLTELQDGDAVGEPVRENLLPTRGGRRGAALELAAIALGRGVRLAGPPFVEGGTTAGAGG